MRSLWARSDSCHDAFCDVLSRSPLSTDARPTSNPTFPRSGHGLSAILQPLDHFAEAPRPRCLPNALRFRGGDLSRWSRTSPERMHGSPSSASESVARGVNGAHEAAGSNVGVEHLRDRRLVRPCAAQAPRCAGAAVGRKRFAATGRFSLIIEHERHHHVHLVLWRPSVLDAEMLLLDPRACDVP